MKPHIVKFFQFLEAKEGKPVSLRIKLLNLDKFKVTKDELTVRGDLDLSNSNIMSLPKGLNVYNNLSLYKCPLLTKLPDGLQVGWDLYLTMCTSLKSLPNELKVGGALVLQGTPLANMYSVNEIRDMIETSGGYVDGNIIMNRR